MPYIDEYTVPAMFYIVQIVPKSILIEYDLAYQFVPYKAYHSTDNLFPSYLLCEI